MKFYIAENDVMKIIMNMTSQMKFDKKKFVTLLTQDFEYTVGFWELFGNPEKHIPTSR